MKCGTQVGGHSDFFLKLFQHSDMFENFPEKLYGKQQDFLVDVVLFSRAS